MDKHEKYIRVMGELFVQQPDKVDSGVAIVHGQRTADPNYAGLFLVSAAVWPVIARLSAEMLSLQCPCSAKLRAFSGDNPRRCRCGSAFDC